MIALSVNLFGCVMAFSPIRWNCQTMIPRKLQGGLPSIMTKGYLSIPSARRTVITKLFTSNSGSSTETIRTLAPGSHVSELEVKKSRFLGYATHAENWSDAITYIEQVKAEHPKARHWCYGFQCGYNPVNERCSDDGEPTGTAGVPILGVYETIMTSKLDCSPPVWYLVRWSFLWVSYIRF